MSQRDLGKCACDLSAGFCFRFACCLRPKHKAETGARPPFMRGCASPGLEPGNAKGHTGAENMQP